MLSYAANERIKWKFIIDVATCMGGLCYACNGGHWLTGRTTYLIQSLGRHTRASQIILLTNRINCRPLHLLNPVACLPEMKGDNDRHKNDMEF